MSLFQLAVRVATQIIEKARADWQLEHIELKRYCSTVLLFTTPLQSLIL